MKDFDAIVIGNGHAAITAIAMMENGNKGMNILIIDEDHVDKTLSSLKKVNIIAPIIHVDYYQSGQEKRRERRKKQRRS